CTDISHFYNTRTSPRVRLREAAWCAARGFNGLDWGPIARSHKERHTGLAEQVAAPLCRAVARTAGIDEATTEKGKSAGVVYGVRGSPYLRSALLGFEEKGAPYRLHALKLGGEKSAEHLVRHPFGRVPSIDHDGFALYETQAILRYVDATFDGSALQPRDAR